MHFQWQCTVPTHMRSKSTSVIQTCGGFWCCLVADVVWVLLLLMMMMMMMMLLPPLLLLLLLLLLLPLLLELMKWHVPCHVDVHTPHFLVPF